MNLSQVKSYTVPIVANGQQAEQRFDLEVGPSFIEGFTLDSTSGKRMRNRARLTIRIGDTVVVDGIRGNTLAQTDAQRFIPTRIRIKDTNLKMTVRVVDEDSPDAPFGAYPVEVIIVYSND